MFKISPLVSTHLRMRLLKLLTTVTHSSTVTMFQCRLHFSNPGCYCTGVSMVFGLKCTKQNNPFDLTLASLIAKHLCSKLLETGAHNIQWLNVLMVLNRVEAQALLFQNVQSPKAVNLPKNHYWYKSALIFTPLSMNTRGFTSCANATPNHYECWKCTYTTYRKLLILSFFLMILRTLSLLVSSYFTIFWTHCGGRAATFRTVQCLSYTRKRSTLSYT